MNGLHRPSLDLRVLHEAGKVVDKGRVDHAVARCRAGDETLVVRQLAPVRLHAARRQGVCPFVGSREAKHGVPRPQQLGGNRRGHVTSRPGQKYAHGQTPHSRAPLWP